MKRAQKNEPETAGRLAVASGGNSGIGEETARAFSYNEGANVALASRDAQ